MIIDTEKLRDIIDVHFANLAEETDDRYKNDDKKAIKAFTRQETEQITYIKYINDIEKLATRFLNKKH